MALSDYLTGKNPFEESDDATVATVATVLRRSEEETAQQTSGSPATVATVAKTMGDTHKTKRISIYKIYQPIY